MLAFGLLAWATSFASAETRSLKLYFIHTGEKAEIIYKRNGRYDQAGLQKINRFLRDWRRNEPTRMDPRLLDLVWEVYRTSGSRAYITRHLRLPFAGHQFDAAQPLQGCGQDQPAHARQGDGFLLAGREA